MKIMPQLICKGIKRETVAKMSDVLPQKLGELSNTPEDYFTFECPQTVYFNKGELTESYPLIEVIQYRRPQDVEEKMAREIAECIKQEGYDICEVYFIHVGEEDYYEF